MSEMQEIMSGPFMSRMVPEIAGALSGVMIYAKDWPSHDTADLKTIAAFGIILFSAASRFYDGPSNRPMADSISSFITGLSVTVGLNIIDTLANGELITTLPEWMVVGALGMMTLEVGRSIWRFVREDRRQKYWDSRYRSVQDEIHDEIIAEQKYQRDQLDTRRRWADEDGKRAGHGVSKWRKPNKTYVPDSSKNPLRSWVKTLQSRVRDAGGDYMGYVYKIDKHTVVYDTGKNSPWAMFEELGDMSLKILPHIEEMSTLNDGTVRRLRIIDPKTKNQVTFLLPGGMSKKRFLAFAERIGRLFISTYWSRRAGIESTEDAMIAAQQVQEWFYRNVDMDYDEMHPKED